MHLVTDNTDTAHNEYRAALGTIHALAESAEALENKINAVEIDAFARGQLGEQSGGQPALLDLHPNLVEARVLVACAHEKLRKIVGLHGVWPWNGEPT